MGFEFPNLCLETEVDALSEAAQGVIGSVMDGTAFQNPFSGQLDTLIGDQGLQAQLLDNLSGAIDSAGAGSDLANSLTNIQNSLIDGAGTDGLFSQLGSFRDHVDTLSGLGDEGLSSLTQRIGIASAVDNVQQSLGNGQGAFSDMFSSLEKGGDLLGSVTDQLSLLDNVLSGDLGDIDLDALSMLEGSLSSLVGGFDIDGNEIAGAFQEMINFDNKNQTDAQTMLQEVGAAQMLMTDNCYIKDMIMGMIGTDELKGNLETAINELNPEQQETQEQKKAEEQNKKAKVQELKSKGVKSEKVAELVGGDQAAEPEEKEKAEQRPVYKETQQEYVEERFTYSDGTSDVNNVTLYGDPVWFEKTDDMSREKASHTGWIQWYGYSEIPDENKKYQKNAPPSSKGAQSGFFDSVMKLPTPKMKYDPEANEGRGGQVPVIDEFTGEAEFTLASYANNNAIKWSTIQNKWVPARIYSDTPVAGDVFLGDAIQEQKQNIFGAEIVDGQIKGANLKYGVMGINLTKTSETGIRAGAVGGA